MPTGDLEYKKTGKFILSVSEYESNEISNVNNFENLFISFRIINPSVETNIATNIPRLFKLVNVFRPNHLIVLYVCKRVMMY